MKRIFMQVPDVNGCGLYRAFLPWANCHEILAQENIELVLDTKLDMREEFDAYIFHRVPTRRFMDVLPKLKERAKIVWETDDLLTHVTDYNCWFPTTTDKDLFVSALELADELIVSTPRLAAELNREDKTVVLPNLIDLTSFPQAPERGPYSPVTILWAGGGSHSRDLEIVRFILLQLENKYHVEKKVRFVFMGMKPDESSNTFWYEYVDWVAAGDYYSVLFSKKPDIGLAPLQYNRFNVCKSAVKFFEYSLAGAVTVATDIEPYSSVMTHGVDGLLCYAEDWFEYLVWLIESPDVRRDMLGNARDTVEQFHSWHANKGVWLDFFRKL